jgi:hypothetical protein
MLHISVSYFQKQFDFDNYFSAYHYFRNSHFSQPLSNTYLTLYLTPFLTLASPLLMQYILYHDTTTFSAFLLLFVDELDSYTFKIGFICVGSRASKMHATSAASKTKRQPFARSYVAI